jgi:hypothetical protein
MKTMRSACLCFVLLLLTAPMLRAQDFSKYRNFSLGTNLAAVLKHTDQRLLDVNATHDGSLLFQELTWRPANGIGVSYRAPTPAEKRTRAKRDGRKFIANFLPYRFQVKSWVFAWAISTRPR